jgi:leader peptidase (prepilin peptidase)/N-methyltransferase
LSPLAARFAVFSFLLIGMIFTDLETRLLPDQFTKGGIVAGILLAAFVPVRGALAVFLSPYLDSRWISVLEAATAAVLLSGVLWLIGVIYQKVRHREGLGFGDVKMVAMIGAFLGIVGALWTMLLGSVSGTAIGLAYMWWKKHDLSHYELPFGTFLGAAALLIAWWT